MKRSNNLSFLPLLALKTQASVIGVELSDEQLAQCDEYARLVVEANEQTNLTRITDPEEMVIQHFIDSFTCIAAHDIPQGGSVMDVGTGAGFPGIPIKIARPDLSVTLVDSTLKKVEFIRGAVASMGLAGVQVLYGRAEEVAKDSRYREKFDAATARAVAQLPIVAELCLPFVKVGGCVLAQKGEEIRGEWLTTGKMVGLLGGAVNEPKKFRLPGVTEARHVVIIKKFRPTPPQYPRSYAEITKGIPTAPLQDAPSRAPGFRPVARGFDRGASTGRPTGPPGGRPAGPSRPGGFDRGPARVRPAGRPMGRPSGPSRPGSFDRGPAGGRPAGRPMDRPSGPGRSFGPQSRPPRPPMRPRRPEK